jgi:CBS domain-containing protein
MRMTVHDVMTGEVVTVREDTSFHDLVRLLAKHHVASHRDRSAVAAPSREANSPHRRGSDAGVATAGHKWHAQGGTFASCHRPQPAVQWSWGT